MIAGFYGDLEPDAAPQSDFWAHWRRCRKCWPHDWLYLGHGDGCLIGKRLAEQYRFERDLKPRPIPVEVFE